LHNTIILIVTHLPTPKPINHHRYAEDPLRNFLPSIGPLNNYLEPQAIPYQYNTNERQAPYLNSEEGVVRIDTGVYQGGLISMWYDPMIAKLCM